MKNTGESFEGYIQFVYQTLLGVQGRNISASRRATVFDNHGNSYNVDILYEFDVAGLHRRVAIECKETRRPVERDDAIAFAGKIKDLPSTIGIFISKSGFQPAARKYLQDHGIVHYHGRDLLHLGSVIAARISPIVSPTESAVGQPFWTLMRQEEEEATGVWCLIPDPSNPGHAAASGSREGSNSGALPLFYSRPHARLPCRVARAPPPLGRRNRLSYLDHVPTPRSADEAGMIGRQGRALRDGPVDVRCIRFSSAPSSWSAA
ncbi:restriction endonuclease [Streptomyces albiflaviniger]|nr:restriction endonuclease [Streptomyces albiflaviniger]